ncbi:MAG: hypothetical protein WC924_06165 [Candidatus Gracilibacteria bacterium]
MEIPLVSVEEAQFKFMVESEVAEAVKLPGVVGGVKSGTVTLPFCHTPPGIVQDAPEVATKHREAKPLGNKSVVELEVDPMPVKAWKFNVAMVEVLVVDTPISGLYRTKLKIKSPAGFTPVFSDGVEEAFWSSKLPLWLAFTNWIRAGSNNRSKPTPKRLVVESISRFRLKLCPGDMVDEEGFNDKILAAEAPNGYIKIANIK